MAFAGANLLMEVVLNNKTIRQIVSNKLIWLGGGVGASIYFYVNHYDNFYNKLVGVYTKSFSNKRNYKNTYIFYYRNDQPENDYNFQVITCLAHYVNKKQRNSEGVLSCDVSCKIITDDNNQRCFDGTKLPRTDVFIDYKDTTFNIISRKYYNPVFITEDGKQFSGKHHEIYLYLTGPSIEALDDFIQFCIKDYDKDMLEIGGGEIIENVKQNNIYYPSIDSKGKLKYTNYRYNNIYSFDSIFLNRKTEILDHVNKFLDPEYKKLRKMSFLLHGPPGTGKTTFIRTLANHLKRTIINVKLSEIKDDSYLFEIFYGDKLEIMNNRDINSGIINIGRHKKLIVFEDIDAECNAVLDRSGDKHSNTNNLTLSGLLQIFDGILSNDNIVTVITTNHKESLDPALIRPGRITMDIELSTINEETILEMLSYYFPEESTENLRNLGIKDIRPAVLENLCLQANTIQELKKLYEE